MRTPPTCLRCGAAVDATACDRCGAPVDDVDALLRQEQYLGFVIDDVLASSDVRASLVRWQTKSATRRRLLAPSIASAPPTTTATLTPSPGSTAWATSAEPSERPTREPLLVDAPAVPISKASAPSTRLEARATAHVAPPTTTLTPQEARAQFERRLEIGGWFTGALFAVGGSLWATNLFWQDIPTALRPALVGGGLALFAAAFMLLGAFLAGRHVTSLAGPVLGVVGRLIGVSATIPLALLARDQPLLAIVVDVVIGAALFFALRRSRRAVDDDARHHTRSAGFYVAGFALAALGPVVPTLAVPAVIAALLLARAAISSSALRALQRQSTWVDDLSTFALAATAIVATLLQAPQASVVVGLVIVAVVEFVSRFVEQRPSFFAARGIVRWSYAIAACIVAAAALADGGVVVASTALAFVVVVFADPARLGLPPLFRFIGVIAAGLIAATIVGTLHIDALSLTAFLVVVLARTTKERTGDVDVMHRGVATFMWMGATLLVLAQREQGWWALLPATVAAALWLTDRRLRTSTPFAWLALPAVLAPFLLIANKHLVDDVGLPIASAVVAGIALVLLALRTTRPMWPLLPMWRAAIAWTVQIAAVAALIAVTMDVADPMLVLTAAIGAVAVVVVVVRTRAVMLGWIVGALFGAITLAALSHGLVDATVVARTAVVAVVLAALSWLPSLRTRALRLGSLPLGYSRHALRLGLLDIATAAVVIVAPIHGASLLAASSSSLLPWWFTSACLVIAAAVLALRRPHPAQLALFGVVVAVAGADIGAIVFAPRLTAIGLGGALAAIALAVVVVVVRAARFQLPAIVRGRARRGRRVDPTPLWSTVVVGTAVVADVVLFFGAISGGTAATMLGVLAVVVAVQAALVFAAQVRALSALVAIMSAVTAPLLFAADAFARGDTVVVLALVLVALALMAAALIASRALYRRREPPSLLVAWPAPWTLRLPVIVAALVVGSVVAAIGQLLQLDRGAANDYGLGVIVVAVALIGVALALWRAQRSAGAAHIGAALVVFAAIGTDGVAHALSWLPRSHGTSQGLVALLLVGALLVLDRRRKPLLGLAWPAPVRRALQRTLLRVVPLVVGVGVLFALRDAPDLGVTGLVLGGVALTALGLAWPDATRLRTFAVGAVVVGIGLGSAIAVGCGFDTAVTMLPFVVAGALAAAAIVQATIAPLLSSSTLRGFHAARAATTSFNDLATTARTTAQSLAIAAIAVLGAVVVVDSAPTSASLLATWMAMSLAVVVMARMALTQQLTWPAALAQGLALAIYVDIRRRTSFFDDVGGIDAIACLVGAAVFIVVATVARRHRRGVGIARAAELYAVVLPGIAAAVGDGAAGRAVVCLVGAGLYALLSHQRRRASLELLCGAAIVLAAVFGLWSQGADDVALYLMPVAFVGTVLARRHRRAFGGLGKQLAVLSHVPLYVAAAWSALSTQTFSTFALAVVVATVGVGYAIRVKDRRALYAAATAAAVLVVGRLVLLGLGNALLGTVLLAGLGVVVLAAMTIFTIRRDVAASVIGDAKRGLNDWE